MTTSTKDEAFLLAIQRQFNLRGEILVEIAYSHAAGSRDFTLFESFQELQNSLKDLRTLTLYTVFLKYDLPVRGIVDGQLIQSARARFTGDANYLIVYRHPRDDWRCAAQYGEGRGWLNSHQIGEGAADLEACLRDTLGEEVAIGLEPECRRDSNDVLYAIAPTADGSVKFGVY